MCKDTCYIDDSFVSYLQDEDGALLDVTNFTIPDGLPVIPPVTRLEEREHVDAVGGAGISDQSRLYCQPVT